MRASDRILAVCNPERIHVFGSAARGDFTHGSDIDLAIVFADEEACRVMKPLVYRAGPLSSYPCDVLCYSEPEFRRKSEQGGICAEILQHGKVVYDKRADPQA